MNLAGDPFSQHALPACPLMAPHWGPLLLAPSGDFPEKHSANSGRGLRSAAQLL